MMNGRNDFGGSGSKIGADGTTNSGTFQQGGYYSGGYALPGVFGDAGPTPGAVFRTAAAPSAGYISSTSSVVASTPMVLANTPPRPPASASVTWGSAAPATPRVLFAPGVGHSEVRYGQVPLLVSWTSRLQQIPGSLFIHE